MKKLRYYITLSFLSADTRFMIKCVTWLTFQYVTVALFLKITPIKTWLWDLEKLTAEKNLLSICCESETIPPDFETAERMGSLYHAYACHICKKCGKACKIIGDII